MITLTTRPFGLGATLFTLTNSRGVAMDLTDFGATLVGLRVPDSKGHLADITLGYDSAEGYANGRSYFGCTVGRYGNRISHASFEIEGQFYPLTANIPPHHLHGGTGGFHQVLWSAQPIAGGVHFQRLSPHGEDGYPGNLTTDVRMTLNEADELEIEYRAVTDAPTHLNLANHAYLNLAGHDAGSILEHEMWIGSQATLAVDESILPNGELFPVEGTPLDFGSSTRIGSRIDDPHPQMVRAGGYDHCFIFSGRRGDLRHIATAADPASGRFMEVLTTEPGVQFYSGNFLDGSERGKGGKAYGYREGFCLETQHYPDTPHHPQFPSTLLHPGQIFSSTTIYRFGAR